MIPPHCVQTLSFSVKIYKLPIANFASVRTVLALASWEHLNLANNGGQLRFSSPSATKHITPLADGITAKPLPFRALFTVGNVLLQKNFVVISFVIFLSLFRIAPKPGLLLMFIMYCIIYFMSTSFLKIFLHFFRLFFQTKKIEHRLNAALEKTVICFFCSQCLFL